jgi:hypothetical protein
MEEIMAHVKVVAKAVNQASPEMALGFNTGPHGVWLAEAQSVPVGGTLECEDEATPGNDWVTWYLEGSAGAKFRIECFINGTSRWVTERIVQVGHSFTGDSKGI